LELHAVGELHVKLIEAKNIKNTDLIGKADPFVVLYVRQTKDKTKRSTSKKNTLKPVWNEEFQLEVHVFSIFILDAEEVPVEAANNCRVSCCNDEDTSFFSQFLFSWPQHLRSVYKYAEIP